MLSAERGLVQYAGTAPYARHGTDCAGTNGAAGNTGEGVAGVCRQVKMIGSKWIADSWLWQRVGRRKVHLRTPAGNKRAGQFPVRPSILLGGEDPAA